MAREKDPDDDLNYRIYIIREYDQRHIQNPRYSLRAFARDIGFSSSKLTEILNFKTGMSVSAAIKILPKLNLSKEDSEVFLLKVQASHSRAKSTREIAIQKLKKQKSTHVLRELSHDQFKVISDWEHYAILEATNTNNFQGSIPHLSKRFNLLENKTKDVVDRLIRLGLLEVSDVNWKESLGNVTLPSDVPSDEVKKFHKQILRKAADSLQVDLVESRDFNSLIFAFDSSKISTIKKMIFEFRKKLVAYLSEAGSKDSVYCFSLQFFPMDKKVNDNE
jgi:uncharacterized protein (TIGR02147 family)